MVDYNINNKEYLLSIKPSYMFIPISLLLSVIILIILICIFKTYDVYNVKGFISCNEKCNISIPIEVNDINKIKNIDFLKINDNEIKYNNFLVGDIQIDEINKINFYNVNFEVDQLDNELLNTFQDIKVYSNQESILYKFKKLLF